MTYLTPKDKLRRAFDTIYDRFPFLASIVQSWEVVPVPGFGTGATNGPQFFYDPAFVNSLNIAAVVDFTLHESGHVFLGHHLRFDERDPKDWNVGADLALNDTLITHYDMSEEIARIALFPGRSKGFERYPKERSAEFYYDLYHGSKPPPPPQPEDGEGEDGEGGEGDESEGANGGAESDSKDGEGKGGSSGSGEGEEGENEAQGGGSATPKVGTGKGDLRPTTSGFGDVLPHPGIAKGEDAKELEEQWKDSVARAINDAKSQGDLPGWLEELGTTLYERKSQVNWKLYLRRFMTKHTPTGFTYTRPSRRHSYRTDVIMPSRHAKGASSGVCLVDTSGSMSVEEMNLALSEIESILNTFQRSDIDLMQVDTRLIEEATKHFTKSDFPLRVPQKWWGRGGTDLAGAILQVGRMRKHKWMIVISDMEWQAGLAKSPGIPVLWVITRPIHEQGQYRPTFGQVIGPIKEGAA